MDLTPQQVALAERIANDCIQTLVRSGLFKVTAKNSEDCLWFEASLLKGKAHDGYIRGSNS